MPKTKMKDMVVLLPGILGSVLKKDGQDIWNLSLKAALGAASKVISRNSLLEELYIKKDEPERDYLDDGIRATGLIQGVDLVPGFFKLVNGYSFLRDRLTKDFDLEIDKNYFEFAYDWRRDNRVSARLLKKLIDNNLPRWQEKSPGAKVILIAHSMGGLICRYYLEHLGGGEHCKALTTLGTPYRGSVKMLNYLANGYEKKPLPALTDILRSFTSVYQLLSMYPVVNVDGNWQRVAETIGIPGVDTERAKEAREFLQLINLPDNLNYANLYEFKPVIGAGQKSTFQSAELSNGKLKVNNILPPNPRNQETLDTYYATGDDTVPQVSAIPVDWSNTPRDEPIIESHGALQSNVEVWKKLKSFLQQLQGGDISDFQNPQTTQSETPPPGISLSFDDLYLRDDEITLSAEIINVNSEILEKFGGLRARITLVSGNGEKLNQNKFQFEQQGDNSYKLTLEPNTLAPGLYRLEVETSKANKQAPKAVHNLFGIAEEQ